MGEERGEEEVGEGVMDVGDGAEAEATAGQVDQMGEVVEEPGAGGVGGAGKGEGVVN